MYLTAGQFKGTKIEVPSDVKPTLSKVRESIFNMLMQYEVYDNTFLDMFSGSGIMGLEAYSRGYRPLLLEINKKNFDIIKKNCSKVSLSINVIKTDALKFKSTDKYSIIYIDPPWANDYSNILKKASELLNDNGIIFVEYDKIRQLDISEILNKSNIPLKIIKSKKYGRCLIDVLQKSYL